MKRDALALLIHPYKNALLQKEKMQNILNAFAEKLLDITNNHQNLRINLVLPGYMLQLMDPLLLSRLNDVHKRDCLEWLTSGYTESFLSFSPLWLSQHNIQFGIEAFSDLVGYKPSGYVPAFSNWEPSAIEALQANRINYAILSRVVLPKNAQNHCGYWISEHNGATMVIIPSYIIHHFSAPANILSWLERITDNAPNTVSTKLIALDYLIPLVPQKNITPFKWLNSFADALDTLLIKYQMNLLHEFTALSQPLGLQYIPPSVVFKRGDDEIIARFSNHIHTFDNVGIMQRKMMDIAESIKAHRNHKDIIPLKKQLFSAQDINRYLPHESSGFPLMRDRFWTFGKMIEIERDIMKNDNITGGQIRIADFLKNGIKSIIMSNKSLKAYINHKNGGQIFELDYRERFANLFAGYNPECKTYPGIMVEGKSHTSFIDRLLDEDCQMADFMSGTAKQRGDFAVGVFDYKVKKTSTAVKTLLTRQGSLIVNGKASPLVMEKVFGLEKDKPDLSFVYQLSNHSLTSYKFKFAVELTFSLPGAQFHQASIKCDKTTYTELLWDKMSFNNITKLILSDSTIGSAIHVVMQKPVTVWCYPSVQSDSYQGTTLVISTPVLLEENSVWSLLGKIICKKIRKKGVFYNAV